MEQHNEDIGTKEDIHRIKIFSPVHSTGEFFM